MLFFKKTTLYHLLLLVVLLYGLYSCASPLAPQGGVKDTRKPRIVFSSPKDQSLNVMTNKVMVVFSEPVRTKNLKTNLVIIPRVNDDDYEYKEKNNTITLKFKRFLRPNTTYVLNFDDAIEDITESNKPENARIAFSTGKEIDTLYLYGTVRNIADNSPEKEATICLYDATDTLVVEKHKPLYFAKTDTLGRYRINNIRKGKYFLYALKEDKKKNMIYDSPDERIGFLTDTLVLDEKSHSFFQLPTVAYDNKSLKITSKRTRKQYFEVKANKNLQGAEVVFENPDYKGKILYQTDKEVLRFYNYTGKETVDSLKAYITVKDSVGKLFLDTATIRFDVLKEKDKAKAKTTSKVFPLGNSKFIQGKKIRPQVFFSSPLDQLNADSIVYMNGKDTTTTKANQWELNETRTVLSFKDSITVTAPISFKLKKGSLISIEKDTLGGIEMTYSLKKEEEYATLSGIVRTEASYFILQVLNEKNEVEGELYNAKEFVFKYVEAGKKKIRLIIDANKNKTWDKGDFKKGIAPENALYFDDEVLQKVAPNWVYEDIIVEVKDGDKR
ncbi:MAG: Ig-like domain-containing domain [Thermoflexibacteraceae bacterium]